MSQQARKNKLLLNKKGGGAQKAPSVNMFYPSNDSCNLNIILNEMDKEDAKVQKVEPDETNIASPVAAAAADVDATASY